MVEAIEITEDNIKEVAELIGYVQTKGDLTFIVLNPTVVPNVHRAFVGWWMTRFGDQYRCYSPKTFSEQFIHNTKITGISFDEEKEKEPVLVPLPRGNYNEEYVELLEDASRD